MIRLLVLILGIAHAQSVSDQALADVLYGRLPDQMKHYSRRFGDQRLTLRFCIRYLDYCEDRIAIAYGQVCDSTLAKNMATNQSGDVLRGIPKWYYEYRGFLCGHYFTSDGIYHAKDEKVFGGGNAMN